MGRVFSQDLYSRYENLSKYNVVYVVRQMVKEGICKTPVQALELLDGDVDVDGLLTRAINGTMPEVSKSDEEDSTEEETVR